VRRNPEGFLKKKRNRNAGGSEREWREEAK
jgi:hypothetical protein